MGKMSRDKGARRERQLVEKLRAAGIPCTKESRSGYTGHDLTVAGVIKAEVKARGSGAGFKTLENWLVGNDLLFLWRDRNDPLVTMDLDTATELLRAYCETNHIMLESEDIDETV